MLRLECSSLELAHDVALQARVIKEQVDEELVAADFDALLTTYESEAGAKLGNVLGGLAGNFESAARW